MQFFKLLAIAASVAVASANVEFTNTQFTNIEAGKPFTITWSGATSPVTLKLKTGPANVQVPVSTIASGLTGNSFTWTPDKSLPESTYNFEIDSGSDINYSVQFPISGGTGDASTLTASASSASSSDSSKSSSTQSSSATTTPSSSSSESSSSTDSSSSSTSSSKSSSSTTTPTKSSSTSSSSTASSTGSVPTSNSAVQHGSPFALVIMGALAIAGLN